MTVSYSIFNRNVQSKVDYFDNDMLTLYLLLADEIDMHCRMTIITEKVFGIKLGN